MGCGQQLSSQYKSLGLYGQLSVGEHSDAKVGKHSEVKTAGEANLECVRTETQSWLLLQLRFLAVKSLFSFVSRSVPSLVPGKKSKWISVSLILSLGSWKVLGQGWEGYFRTGGYGLGGGDVSRGRYYFLFLSKLCMNKK